MIEKEKQNRSLTLHWIPIMWKETKILNSDVKKEEL